jgi:hypothetical protein
MLIEHILNGEKRALCNFDVSYGLIQQVRKKMMATSVKSNELPTVKELIN